MARISGRVVGVRCGQSGCIILAEVFLTYVEAEFGSTSSTITLNAEIRATKIATS
jgi:hypothetical protein